MKFGLIHYNAPGGADLDVFLRYAVDSGFDCTELQIQDVWNSNVENPERRAEEVRRLADSLGIAVSALSAGNDFVQVEEEAIQAQVERMKRVAGLAQILGTNVLRTEGGQPKESVPEARWVDAMAGCIGRCLEFAEEMGTKFAVDNHGYVTNAPGILPALFERLPSPCLGTNLDTMNYRWWGNSVEECDRIYAQVAAKTFSTHMKDGTGSRGEYVGAALGEGEIHLDYAVKTIKAAGYQGPWVAEYEGRTDSGEGYQKCLAWMKAHIA